MPPPSPITRPRRLPVRPIEPPYDDERGDETSHPWRDLSAVPADQPALQLIFPPRRLRPALRSNPTPAGQPAPEAADIEGLAEVGLTPAWRSTPRAELCDPLPWSRQLARGIAEVLVGTRPARQLSAWLTEDSHATLRRSAWRRRVRARVESGRTGTARAGTPRQSSRIMVRSVHLSEPRDGVAEISAHLWIDGRGTAVALRAEGRDGRWICTAIDIG
jgi:Family of unknown function (DUF6459)